MTGLALPERPEFLGACGAVMGRKMVSDPIFRGGDNRTVGEPTRIKICGLTREADVDAAVQAGAHYLGFVLYPPSPRHVALWRAAELAARLPR